VRQGTALRLELARKFRRLEALPNVKNGEIRVRRAGGDISEAYGSCQRHRGGAVVVERGGRCALGVCGLTDGADSFRNVCGLRRAVLREARYWRVVLDRGAGCA
jgi:hypothetical protein